MGLSIIDIHDINELALKSLDLDPDALDLISIEATSALIRRVAGSVCPCSAHQLTISVFDLLEGLSRGKDDLFEAIQNQIESLIAYGDLQEHCIQRENDPRHSTFIYASPPAFVRRESGVIYIIGIIPDHNSPLPEDLEELSEVINHVRIIRSNDLMATCSQLINLGFVEIPLKRWLEIPETISPENYIAKMDYLLKDSGNVGELSDISFLDTKMPVNYYRKRWKKMATESGRFIARRKQLYGSDLWCYIELSHGTVKRMIDLPILSKKERGCDEAWRLQLAIDAIAGNHQKYRLRAGYSQNTIMDIFSPVPSWAIRRWDMFGNPSLPQNCLFSYSFANADVEEETKFLTEVLWLRKLAN